MAAMAVDVFNETLLYFSSFSYCRSQVAGRSLVSRRYLSETYRFTMLVETKSVEGNSVILERGDG